ncbi:MAG TPA: hypothetical protein VHO90_13955, partial [Bacteroidales bacterium]|nr:hypothetical protein [Bacteroidales bacterium]
MKSIKNLLLITAICLTVFSCKKDDDEKNPADFPFSKEGVEENKAKLEDAGQQMITEMKTMESVKANAVLESFVNCSSQDDPLGSMTSKSAPVFRTLDAASTLSEKENALDFLTQMMKEDVSEETPTFQKMFDVLRGVYTWNAATKAWAKTASSSEFKFLFPAKVDGTTNDASLVIKYSGKNVTSSMLEFGDLPVSLNLTMASGSEKVFEMDLQASYDDNGLPTKVNYFIALYPYKYEMTWNYSSSNVSLRYHLTNGSKNILDIYGKMNGTFSMEDISNSATSEDSEEIDLVS